MVDSSDLPAKFTWQRPTEDEFLQVATGLPADEARAMGFSAERCACRGRRPWCDGWQLCHEVAMARRKMESGE